MFPLCPLYGEFLITNGYWILSKAFWCIYWDNHVVFIFKSLIWYITLMDFQTVSHPRIPEINPTWSYCVILLMYCWIQFVNICWGFLHLCSSVILAYNFIFLWCICLILLSCWYWPHRSSSEEFIPPQFWGIFWEG